MNVYLANSNVNLRSTYCLVMTPPIRHSDKAVITHVRIKLPSGTEKHVLFSSYARLNWGRFYAPLSFRDRYHHVVPYEDKKRRQ